LISFFVAGVPLKGSRPGRIGERSFHYRSHQRCIVPVRVASYRQIIVCKRLILAITSSFVDNHLSRMRFSQVVGNQMRH